MAAENPGLELHFPKHSAAAALFPSARFCALVRPPLFPLLRFPSCIHQDGRIVSAVSGRNVEAQRASLRQGDVADLDILVGPLVEQLDAANLADDVLGQDLVARGGLDLDLSVVRHIGQFGRRDWRVGCRRLVGRRGISFGWVGGCRG